MTLLTVLADADVPGLGDARAAGFDKLSYSIDLLDGVIDPPVEMFGMGFTLDYMSAFLPRLREDPLRHMIARGEVEVRNTPVAFENMGDEIVVGGDMHLSARDPSLLVWCLGEGIRTGLSFRIRLDRGRCVSLNFYSSRRYAPDELERAIPTVFLAGHRVHQHMEGRRARRGETPLSRREVECLEAMARGRSNCEIARELGLSTDTVKEYSQSLYRKLQVRSRAEAVARGYALTYLD